MLNMGSNPEHLKKFAEMKEKEEKLIDIIEEGDGRKYKVTKLDMDKFKIVAHKVKIQCFSNF